MRIGFALVVSTTTVDNGQWTVEEKRMGEIQGPEYSAYASGSAENPPGQAPWYMGPRQYVSSILMVRVRAWVRRAAGRASRRYKAP